VSADYFGRFAAHLAKALGAENAKPPFVAMMSQGTSGDLHWMDYSQPRKAVGIDAYSRQLAGVARDACRAVRHRPAAALAVRERTLRLARRTPDAGRLAWARKIAGAMGDRRPRNHAEVYAHEQLCLHAEPVRELKLQAIRVGDLGIAAIPCEVFGITGLEIKARSPLARTLTIELANGAEGYIPPPAQHELGGYTTWPARTAALETQAEGKIVEALLTLLEGVSGKPRREAAEPRGAWQRAVLASRPWAYWRLGEFRGPRAHDAAGKGRHGTYEGPMAFYLPGRGRGAGAAASRAVHLAGGHLAADADGLPAAYTVELWFANGLPADARAITGCLLSRAAAKGADDGGECLAIGGAGGSPGRLIFFRAGRAKEALAGRTALETNTWNHVALVRDGKAVKVFLNGAERPEIAASVAWEPPAGGRLILGAAPDGSEGLEGRIDEAAVYARPLTAQEVRGHWRAARPEAPPSAERTASTSIGPSSPAERH
jgi:hypothetical protein